jgi:hypothetical protein
MGFGPRVRGSWQVRAKNARRSSTSLLESTLPMVHKPTLRLLLVPLLGLAGCYAGSDLDDPNGGEGASAAAPMGPVDGVSIDQIAIYQAVKVQLMLAGAPVPPSLAVIEGRNALVRVFTTALANYNGLPVIARLTLGQQPPIEIPAALAGISTDGSLQSTINFEVPGALLVGALDYRVDLLQLPEQTTGTNGAAMYPAPEVRDPLVMASSGPQLRIVLVPIAYGADGSNRLPDTSDAQLQLYRDWFSGIYPTPLVDLKVGAQLSWAQSVDAGGYGWYQLLDAMTSFRQQSGAAPDEYYFGLFAPASSFNAYCMGGCVTGMSNLAGPSDAWGRAGIGLGFAGEIAAQTAVHETGHMHGLEHAPCGGPDGVDYGYPYDGAVIGVWGYSLPRRELYSPTGAVDMMSYCDPYWISDYNFIKLFERIRVVNGASARVLPPQDAAHQPYERISIGPGSEARWLDPLELDTPPGGEPMTALVHVGGKVVPVKGSWHRYSDLPGGVLLFPEPPILPTKVELSVDGHWTSVSRDQLTHLTLTNRPGP